MHNRCQFQQSYTKLFSKKNKWHSKRESHIQLRNISPLLNLFTISSTFHSFFKVLFIFPSRYLFAIGLLNLFSLWWSSPPTSSCNPKQLDSKNSFINATLHNHRQGFHLLWLDFPIKFDYKGKQRTIPYTTTLHKWRFRLGYSLFTRRYWGNHSYFLFLCLVRCFNSAGNLTSLRLRLEWFSSRFKSIIW